MSCCGFFSAATEERARHKEVRGVESGKFASFCVYFSTRICSAGDLWRWKQKVLCSNNKRRRPTRSEEKRTKCCYNNNNSCNKLLLGSWSRFDNFVIALELAIDTTVSVSPVFCRVFCLRRDKKKKKKKKKKWGECF